MTTQTTTQTPTPLTTLDDLLSNSFEENDALLSRASVRKHLFSSSQSRFFVEDLNKTSSSEEEKDATVFSRLRLNERTIALTRLVDLANGEEEEKEERAGEEKEKEEEEKKKRANERDRRKRRGRRARTVWADRTGAGVKETAKRRRRGAFRWVRIRKGCDF